ncbi:MAG: hypothetical protein JOZ33_14920 [Acidobacteriaceae bacterium]|nr:hypothetical protein [Acidobacteriaceae bacterium]
MIQLRKLAALEVLFLGPKLVLAEYSCGVLFSAALGIFVLLRGHTAWQTVLGIYLICIGLNYLPLFFHAVALRNPQTARDVIADELSDTRKAFSRYRWQSLLLVVPLFVAVLGLVQARRAGS